MEDLKVFVNFKQGLSDFMVELQKTPSNVLKSFAHLIELKNPHFIIKQVLSQYTPVKIVSNSEFLPDIVNLFLSVCDPQAFVTLKSLVTSCKEPKYDEFSSALNEYLNRKLVFDEKANKLITTRMTAPILMAISATLKVAKCPFCKKNTSQSA